MTGGQPPDGADTGASRPVPSGPEVVALGGGHGLSASLQALRQVTTRLTAVVTVADDGGSSGRLRAELGQLPPGDLRMALSALARDDEWGATWTALLQHRFGGQGPLAGHAVGNLLLAGLTECNDGDTVRALDLAARLVGAVGRVLPMSAAPLVIAAQVAGLDPDEPSAIREVVGQVAVATTPGRVASVQLRPSDPPACEQSVRAVLDADWVVLGPGSWFTSVLPHLMVPDLRAALVSTPARRVVCLNLAEQAGETEGLSPQDHLQVLLAHCPELRIDVVLGDRDAVVDAAALRHAVEAVGARLVLAPVALGDGTPRHCPERLAAAYADVLTAPGPAPDLSRAPLDVPEDDAWR